jgi:hypothetical protein
MRRGLREQIRPPRVRIRTPQGRIWAQLARTGIAAMKEMTTTKVRTRGGKERRGGGRWKPCRRHPCGRADLRQPLRWRQGAGGGAARTGGVGREGPPKSPRERSNPSGTFFTCALLCACSRLVWLYGEIQSTWNWQSFGKQMNLKTNKNCILQKVILPNCIMIVHASIMIRMHGH